jgi:hypothetical protein
MKIVEDNMTIRRIERSLSLTIVGWMCLFFMCFLSSQAVARAFGAADTFWAPSREDSPRSVDHSAWQAFLDRYTTVTGQSDQVLVRYGAVTPQDRQALRAYLRSLESVPVRQLPRREQLPFWVNLFNAQVVSVVLDHYPLESIRDVRFGWWRSGPWSEPLVRVEGKALSLDDIADHILRPLWRDSRIHYVLHRGSLGSPDLPRLALTAANAPEVIEAAARTFINHPRAVSDTEDGWMLSSVYDWYDDDFGTIFLEVKAAIMLFAGPELTRRLKTLKEADYAYDWRLNDATPSGHGTIAK